MQALFVRDYPLLFRITDILPVLGGTKISGSDIRDQNGNGAQRAFFGPDLT